MSPRQSVIVLDYGSQYTQLIARRIRECHVYCEIHPCSLQLAGLRALDPRALVLSGGPQSVYQADAPKSDPALLELGMYVATSRICTWPLTISIPA